MAAEDAAAPPVPPPSPFTQVLDVARWIHDELEALGVFAQRLPADSQGVVAILRAVGISPQHQVTSINL